MNNKFLFIVSFLFVFSLMNAELLLNENFDFTGKLTDNGWTAHDNEDTYPISTTNGLTYSGYASSGIGNAALLHPSDYPAECDDRTFTEITSGTIYASFLVKVVSGQAPTSYFFHFGNSPSGTDDRAQIYFQKDAKTGNLEFGLSMSVGAQADYTDPNYFFGTTYLIIVKYEIVTGIYNDEVSLFVFSSGIPASEPVIATLGPLTGTDASELASVALRQYHSVQNVIVDGIRIATTWDDAPLPVMLYSFTAIYANNHPTIFWTTQSETNNEYWNIYRSVSQNLGQAFHVNAGDIIEGAGTTSEPTDYEYVDMHGFEENRTYYYWLESVDTSGETELFGPISLTIPWGEEDFGTPAAPDDYGLQQNYPNPFNPSTEICFALKEAGNAKLTIYNIMGKKIKTIFNGSVPADIIQSAIWNGKDESGKDVASGSYLYVLEAGSNKEIKRMLLVK